MTDWYSADSLSPSEELEPQPGNGSDDEDRPFREGLPPSYAMRHDRHYVDALDARSPTPPIRMLPLGEIQPRPQIDEAGTSPLVESIRDVGVLQPILVRRATSGYELIAGSKRLAAATAVGLTELPCRVCDVDDGEARRLAEADDLRGLSEGSPGRPPTVPLERQMSRGLAEIADSLGAALSCWDLSTQQPRRTYTPAVHELTRVEIQRAAWLALGLQVLTDRSVPTKTKCSLSGLLDRALAATRLERRLALSSCRRALVPS